MQAANQAEGRRRSRCLGLVCKQHRLQPILPLASVAGIPNPWTTQAGFTWTTTRSPVLAPVRRGLCKSHGVGAGHAAQSAGPAGMRMGAGHTAANACASLSGSPHWSPRLASKAKTSGDRPDPCFLTMIESCGGEGRGHRCIPLASFRRLRPPPVPKKAGGPR